MSKNSGKARYQEIRDLIGMSGKTTDFRPSNTYLGFGGSSDVSGNKTTNSFANQNFQFEPLMRITKLQTKESKPQIDKRPSPFSANLTDLYFPNNRPQSNMASQKDFSSREEVIYSKQEQGVQKDLPPIPNFREPNLINESNFEILKSDNEEEYELTTKLKPTKVCPVPTEHGLSFDLVFNEAEALKKKQKSGNRAYLSTATTQVTRNSPKRSEEAEDDLDDLLSKRPFIVKKGTDASAHLKNYASSSGLRLNTAESDKFAYPFKKTTELRIINMMSKSIPNWRQNSVKNLKTETSPLATPILGARPFTAADTKLLPIQKSATFKSKRSSVSSKKSIKNQKSLSNLDELSKETSAKPTQNELPPEVPENAEEKDPTPEPQLPPLINTQSSLSPRGLLQAVLPPIVEEKDHGLLPLKDIDEDPIKLTAIVKGPPLSMFEAFPEETQEIMNTIQSVEEKLFARYTILNNTEVEKDYSHLKIQRNDMIGEMEIKIVREEYAKKKAGRLHMCNWERVDKVLNNLKFFSKLSKPVRISLLRESDYFFMESGKTVFKQGDFGDLMYVILRGSVNVLQKRKTFYGEVINQTIAVLYDGNHFGELAMLGTATKNPKKDAPKEGEKKEGEEKKDEAKPGEEKKDEEKKESMADKYKSLTLEEKIEKENQNKKEALGNVEPPKPKKEEIEGRSQRKATIVVSESADFLALPRDKFKSVFLDLVQKELDAKLNILMSLHFFDKIDPISLISLANNINVRTYKMGELILGAGEEMDRLRIIAGGKCRIVMAVVKSSELEASAGRSSLIKPLKNLTFSQTDYTCASTTRVKEEPVIKVPKIKSNLRAFDFEPLTDPDDENNKEIKYIQHITFGVLGKSDFFGARGVFTREEYLAVDEEAAIPQTYFGPSKLNVVADSYMVEIYEIERDRLPFIHEYVRNLLKKGLKDSRDFDDLDVAEEIKKIENWEAMKQWTMQHNMKPKVGHYDNFKKY